MRHNKEEKKATQSTLTKQLLVKLKECEECKHNPVVFLTADAIPVCDKHWTEIAESNTEW